MVGWIYKNRGRLRATHTKIVMEFNQDLITFLGDIKKKNYDREFISFHASNLLMQEGTICYDVNLGDNDTVLILDFFVKLDSEYLKRISLNEIIDDLIKLLESGVSDEIQILFTLYKTDIMELYQKYLENKLSIESLKSAFRKYCNRKEDFDKLIDLARG
jgi:hypothetical protein